jgi:hypothetical protein
LPYIKEETRLWFDDKIERLAKDILNPGDLCYCIYKLMKDVILKNGPNFKIMSRVISEVECAKLEFYRRIVSPYEDKKIEENGDIK